MGGKKKLLLHSCCGPCSTAVIEKLNEEYEITIFFYNPNITSEHEYQKRRTAQLEFIEKYNLGLSRDKRISFAEGAYDTDAFYKAIKGYEKGNEGGERCRRCFELRMSETAKKAHDAGIPCFETTLSVSPYKSYKLISSIGTRLAEEGLIYLDGNYKKKSGYERSVKLSKEYSLYRQKYCGCEFSKK